jgi:hypothetical protein
MAVERGGQTNRESAIEGHLVPAPIDPSPMSLIGAFLSLARTRGSRPAWVPVQLKDDSRVWISAIVKSRITETGGVNGTLDPLVNTTANGHTIGIIMMDNVTSGGRMPRIPATARDVQFSPRGCFD